MKGKVLKFNVKTKKKEIIEKDFPEPKPYVEPKGFDTEKGRKLIEYAESQGWI